jgi:hypothetical protein
MGKNHNNNSGNYIGKSGVDKENYFERHYKKAPQ